ncbi:universal stress protein [Jiella sp. M17.18]|uniref:universal stress protein n=1 Tax=Jiella sp. M17.18 TaxID=3234247 RepID=UPI0034DFAA93
MKTILVPVEQHDSARFALDLAATLAERFDSVIEGFALQVPPLAGIGWDPASVAMIHESDWDHRQAIAKARQLFRDTMAEHGLHDGAEAASDASASRAIWNEAAMAGEGFLGGYGRAFDLTVVGQPRAGGSSITTLEAALFDSGGPILLVPPKRFDSVGETVVIAWNGSSETARTIALAMPLIRKAKRVVVLSDDGGIGDRPAGSLIQRRLERNGIAAELKLLPDKRIRSGEAILSEAAALGCDLLVKGAYTQSRLRQMIFGGATNHILANAEMPVILAH